MNKKLQVLKYVVGDFLMAALAWSSFYAYRKLYIEPQKFGMEIPLVFDRKFYLGLVVIPFFWMLAYWLVGSYRNIYRRSRLSELLQVFVVSIIGVLIIFFALLLDDSVPSYRTYYQSLLVLFSLHFFLTATLRFIFTTITNYRVHQRAIGFNTLLVGSNHNAWKLFGDMENHLLSSGNKFLGFVHVDNTNGFSSKLKDKLSHLGDIKDLRKIVEEKKIEEVIVAIESSEHDNINRIINELEDMDIIIKVIPDMYDILSGQVKMTSIFGAPLIEISRQIMPVWQQSFKRIFDFVLSLFMLVFLFPFFILIAIIIKLTSTGRVLYSHERVGWHGKPFTIYKFRSMYLDAEKRGPALSSEHDSRVTPFGRFLRRFRLDELPQFYNVLIGDMSMVGPRPERQFFIDLIMNKASHYRHMHKVRPGITSWGQVKYGYAENVDQMIERLKYDIIYIENMSLMVDVKILFYTLLIVLQGRGK